MKTNGLGLKDGIPKIGILDAGGQYCHLIARKIRELGVYAEIRPCSTSANHLKDYKGIVISGGPASVTNSKKPDVDRRIFDLNLPVLGICYGHQIIAESFGGRVRKGERGEYGIAELSVKGRHSLFQTLNKKEPVWMNHRDVVEQAPPGFEVIGATNDCQVAAMASKDRRFYGLQFHPEVVHTKSGKVILRNFVQEVCSIEPSWKPQDRTAEFIQQIKQQVGSDKNVFFLVSGGVDSTVAFSLCVMALGKSRVKGLYVDTGFMRKYDYEAIDHLRAAGFDNIQVVDASKEFVKLLEDVWEPEEKRKMIGKKFLEITEHVLGSELQLGKDNWIIGQGTIYPDTIESGGTEHAARIKTHHNRVSLVQELIEQGRVIEPLQELYKDEVRELGFKIAEEKGLPAGVILRHPFPGPGLAIRCLVSPEERNLVDHSTVDEIASQFDFGAATLPLRSVGVQGDERSYSYVVVLAGNTLPMGPNSRGLEGISTAITNSVVNVNRVTYCLTQESLALTDWHIKEAHIDVKRLDLLRSADDTVMRFLMKHGLLSQIWQFPVVLIPFSNKVTNGETIVLRPVDSIDGMTAQYSNLNLDLLRELSKELLALGGIDAVLLDVTNKPPATIEWE